MSEPTGSAASEPNDQSGSASSDPTPKVPVPSAPASTSPATQPAVASTPTAYTYIGDDERYYPDPPYVIDVQPGHVLTGVDEPPADGRWRPATPAEISAAEGAK